MDGSGSSEDLPVPVLVSVSLPACENTEHAACALFDLFMRSRCIPLEGPESLSCYDHFKVSPEVGARKGSHAITAFTFFHVHD